jgi:hypothetical protein
VKRPKCSCTITCWTRCPIVPVRRLSPMCRASRSRRTLPAPRRLARAARSGACPRVFPDALRVGSKASSRRAASTCRTLRERTHGSHPASRRPDRLRPPGSGVALLIVHAYSPAFPGYPTCLLPSPLFSAVFGRLRHLSSRLRPSPADPDEWESSPGGCRGRECVRRSRPLFLGHPRGQRERGDISPLVITRPLRVRRSFLIPLRDRSSGGGDHKG